MATLENWQRIRTVLVGGIPDAVPISELVYWPETVERWHREGLPNDQSPGEYFCGDVRELIPLYIEAGFDAIQPLEARAGNDVRQLKRQYGRQGVFIGNISTDAMSLSPKAIREEVEGKLPVAKEGKGYVFHSDHSIPPSVSLENYCYTLELVERYGQH